MTESLPAFRYHPDPVGTGAIAASTQSCRCCGQARGFVSTLAPYATVDLRDALCPWCIADGSAASAFDAVFTIISPTEPGAIEAADAAIDEVAHRTPGFSGWTQERWLFCCGDAAAYQGAVGWDDLVDHPTAVADLRRQAEAWGFVEPDVTAVVGSLDVDGASTAYLFCCLHCGTHHAYADLDDE